MPLLSIVVPTFNRASLVLRAVSSCLRQGAGEFQIVVVDDASTDGTLEVLDGVKDSRVRTVKLGKNRGACGARAAGVDCCDGEWILFLDSDDELADGAIRRIGDLVREEGELCDRFAFMVRRDDGQLSPSPPVQREIVGYDGWLKWMEGTGLADMAYLARKTTFTTCRWPLDRATECQYHLDFSVNFRTSMIPEVIVLVHQDAPNHLMGGYDGMEETTIQEHIASDIRVSKEILDRHGEALARWAPGKLRGLERVLIMSHSKAGHRLVALRLALRHLAKNPSSFYALSLVPLSISGRGALTTARRIQQAAQAFGKWRSTLPWQVPARRDRAVP